MRTKLQIMLRVCFGVSLVGLLAGCAAMTTREISAVDPIDYNKVVEQAQNEMLFLNIVRASKRSPMYFTSVGGFHGSETFSIGTGSSFPFGGAATAAYSVTPTATFTTNPSLDIAIWDKKEFLTKIFEPMDLKTVQYYWQQGWSKEMLLNLLVQRMKLVHPTNGQGQPEIFSGSLDDPNSYTPPDEKNFPTFQQYSTARTKYNNNGHYTDFQEFQNELRRYKDCDLVTFKNSTSIGPELEVKPANLTDLSKMADDAKKIGLTLGRKDNGKYQLSYEEIGYYFKFKDKRQMVKVVPDDESEQKTDETAKPADEDMLYVTIRSPEGILYRLGEIMRAEANGYIPTITLHCGTSVPLFLACKKEDMGKPQFKDFIDHKSKTPFVTVNYEKNALLKEPTYVIPRLTIDADESQPYANNSIHVLSFISLLINKQKTAAEAPPTTSTVNVNH